MPLSLQMRTANNDTLCNIAANVQHADSLLLPLDGQTESSAFDHKLAKSKWHSGSVP